MKNLRVYKILPFILLLLFFAVSEDSRAEDLSREECIVEESENGDFVYDEQCLDELEATEEEPRTLKELVEEAMGRSTDEDAD